MGMRVTVDVDVSVSGDAMATADVGVFVRGDVRLAVDAGVNVVVGVGGMVIEVSWQANPVKINNINKHAAGKAMAERSKRFDNMVPPLGIAIHNKFCSLMVKSSNN